MDNYKCDRRKRAAIAGSVRVRRQVQDIVNEQQRVNRELVGVTAQKTALTQRQRILKARSEQFPVEIGSGSTNRVLNESVLQLALLELLCNLDRINDSKEESIRNRLQQQSMQIVELNRLAEVYANTAAQIDLTKRLALELAES